MPDSGFPVPDILNLYVWFGRSESIYKTESAVVKFIVSLMFSFWIRSMAAGSWRLVVVKLSQASVQETSSKVKATVLLFVGSVEFLQEFKERITIKIKKKKECFMLKVQTPYLIYHLVSLK